MKALVGIKRWVGLAFTISISCLGCGQDDQEPRGRCFYQCVCYFPQQDFYDSGHSGSINANNEDNVYRGMSCDVFAADFCESTDTALMGEPGVCKRCRYQFEKKCIRDPESDEFVPEGCLPDWLDPINATDEYCVDQYQQQE